MSTSSQVEAAVQTAVDSLPQRCKDELQAQEPPPPLIAERGGSRGFGQLEGVRVRLGGMWGTMWGIGGRDSEGRMWSTTGMTNEVHASLPSPHFFPMSWISIN